MPLIGTSIDANNILCSTRKMSKRTSFILLNKSKYTRIAENEPGNRQSTLIGSLLVTQRTQTTFIERSISFMLRQSLRDFRRLNALVQATFSRVFFIAMTRAKTDQMQIIVAAIRRSILSIVVEPFEELDEKENVCE